MQEVHQGGHTLPTRVGARPTPWACPLPRGPPGGPPMTILCYMKSFIEKKPRSNLSGRNSAATRRNLGGTNLGLWRSCSVGETSLRKGKSSPSSSPTLLSSGGGQSPSTSSPAPSPLKTLVHLLYPILVSKPGIGTCRLLVVLITPCS